MKTYTFILMSAGPTGKDMWSEVDRYQTQARTLEEASCELRHFIRVHHPEMFDSLPRFAYTTVVQS